MEASPPPPMSPLARHTPESVAAELQAAAIEFGRNLRRWRLAQGWSQNTPQDWAQAIGIACVFNSQWSQLETARLKGPQPLVFRALGAMNALLSAGQYGPITDRDLLERVRQAHPICHPDGTPWHGADFYAAFTGILEWPPLVGRLQPISATQAAEFSGRFRDTVRAEAKRRALAIGVAVGDLLDHVPEDRRDRIEDALLGDDFTAAELMALREPDGTLLPDQWVKDWCGVNIPAAGI
jgi:transcriptional regulator with XRE-family HTH domain